MNNPADPTLLKELAREPLVYVIAVIIGTGGYLMKGSSVGPTWGVGLALMLIGVIGFLIKLIASLIDASFKKRYTVLLDGQEKSIKSLNQIIKSLSKNTIAAHSNLTQVPTDKLSGGYVRETTGVTSTDIDIS